MDHKSRDKTSMMGNVVLKVAMRGVRFTVQSETMPAIFFTAGFLEGMLNTLLFFHTLFTVCAASVGTSIPGGASPMDRKSLCMDSLSVPVPWRLPPNAFFAFCVALVQFLCVAC